MVEAKEPTRELKLHEKIAFFINRQKMLKKDFYQRVLETGLVLSRNGSKPKMSTFYQLLDGRREIKEHMIPYFAEALGVEVETLLDRVEEPIKIEKMTKGLDDKVKRIIDLSYYVPPAILDDIIAAMENYKNHTERFVKRF